MTAETPSPQGEQPQRDPVQEARRSFNTELLGREYHTGVLLTRTLKLQNVLLQSALSPERIYHELSVVAGQAADRAEIYEDADTTSTLRVLQTGFQLTYETFRPSLEVAARATQPTRIENLPPMTSAKGGEVRAQTLVRPQPQTQAEAPKSPEATPASQEKKETSETNKPQSPQKKPGKPPKNPQK